MTEYGSADHASYRTSRSVAPVRLQGDGLVLAGDRWTAAPASRGTVLLLHGGGQTRHSWRATGWRVSQAGWDALALDTRGHGDSERAPDGDYSLDALAADLRQVVAQLPGPPVLVGASLGGLTALLAEGESPGTARALVLVDVVPRVEQAGAARIVAFMRQHAREGFATLDDVVSAIKAYNPGRSPATDPDGVRKNVRLGEDGRWYWHWDPALLDSGSGGPAGQEQRLRRAAAGIRVPTLLVRGRQSDVVSDRGAAELLDLVPGARTMDVAEAGHMVAGDDNDVFAAGLEGLLAELP